MDHDAICAVPAAAPESRTVNLAAPLRPSQNDAEAAMRTLLAWFGDDPERAGLVDTPTRVATAFPDMLSGYRTDPAAVLTRSMMPEGGSAHLLMLRSIRPFSM